MKLSFVGSGNVADVLANAFYHLGEEVLSVYSPTKYNSELLAHKVGAVAVNSINEIDSDTEVLFLCVPDDTIKEVCASIQDKSMIVLHTSGSKSLDVLNKENSGVFYPLQSFSKGVDLDLIDVPILLEAKNTTVEIAIDKLASKLTNIVRFKNSEDRASLHIAAVFANNFTNYMLACAEELCKVNRLDFKFLKPLVIQTVAKAYSIGPKESQTGPAVRGDQGTINQHLEVLEKMPEMKLVYEFMSKSILEANNKE